MPVIEDERRREEAAAHARRGLRSKRAVARQRRAERRRQITRRGAGSELERVWDGRDGGRSAAVASSHDDRTLTRARVGPDGPPHQGVTTSPKLHSTATLR